MLGVFLTAYKAHGAQFSFSFCGQGSVNIWWRKNQLGFLYLRSSPLGRLQLENAPQKASRCKKLLKWNIVRIRNQDHNFREHLSN